MIDVDKLEAGLELDALVAAKVMGAAARRHNWVEAGYPGSLDSWTACEYCGKKITQAIEKDSCPPPYSTDIAAAWEVVELFQKRGTINLRFFQGGGPEVAWKVRIRPDILRDGDPGVEEAAETAPLAICRAALKAVGA